jgi:hypothetical protein
MGVALRNRLPALADRSEIETPRFDLALTTSRVNESMEVAGAARSLYHRVVKDLVEYLLPDLDWEGWRCGSHVQWLCDMGRRIGGLSWLDIGRGMHG